MQHFNLASAEDVSAFVAAVGADAVCEQTGSGFSVSVADEFNDVANSVLSNLGEARKPRLAQYAAGVRYAGEIRGIAVGGVKVATDDRSKQMVMGARINADANPDFTTPWVGSDGAITVLNSTQIIGISNAVLQHVAGCFQTFAEVVAQIKNGTITTTQQVDAAFARVMLL